jgi:ABC-type transport system involved in multi-copper enzyme maturation permease subunit
MTQVVPQTIAKSGFPEVGPPGLLDTMRSEWTKLKTLRSTPWTLAIAVVLVIGLSALLAFIIAANESSELKHGNLPDPLQTIQSGWSIGFLAFMVLGVLTVSNEYSSGLIGVTLLATPKRSRVLIAKVIVFSVSMFVIAEIMSFINFFIGHAIISAYPAYPNVSLSTHLVLRAVIGMGIYVTLVGLLGLSAGALLRHTAGAIVACVAFIFILPGLLSALPDSWSNPIGEYWPTEAGRRIILLTHGPNTLSAWSGTADLAVFVAILLTLACYILSKRDA